MKIEASHILALGAVGLTGYIVFVGPKAVAAGAKKIGAAVNPTSPDNLVNRGVNQLGDVLDDADDNDSFSLGSALYDLTQRIRGIPPYDPNRPVRSVASDDIQAGGPPQ